MNKDNPESMPSSNRIDEDISLANDYRLEAIKHLMSLAAAALVFTITFLKDVIPASRIAVSKSLIASGWFCLIISLMAGVGHFIAWERFYISYRDYRDNPEEGKKARTRINRWRKGLNFIQIAGFILGLILLSIFCFKNL